MVGLRISNVQWGSENWTSSVFKWSHKGWIPNGLVFERHLNTRQPDDLNTGQMDAILFFMYWSSIRMVGLEHCYTFISILPVFDLY